MSAFDRLLKRLDLAQEAEQAFVGRSGNRGVTEENRLYGGLVLAQAAVAAARTVPGLPAHALHGFFLRPGRPGQDIRFAVEVTKAGRRFHTRCVTAVQGDKPILQLLISFSANEPSVEHQSKMPAAPAPEGLPNRDQARGRRNQAEAVIDVRLCDPLTARVPLPGQKRVWLKPTQAVPDDPIVHLALLVYATDRAFLSTAWRPHADHGQLAGASLDHSLWLHEAPRFDDWLLYDMHSPAARHARGLVQGALYHRSGSLLGNVAQQGTLSYRPWPS